MTRITTNKQEIILTNLNFHQWHWVRICKCQKSLRFWRDECSANEAGSVSFLKLSRSPLWRSIQEEIYNFIKCLIFKMTYRTDIIFGHTKLIMETDWISAKSVKSGSSKLQCWGPGIPCLLTPASRIRNRNGNKSRDRIGDEHPGSYFWELGTYQFFGFKIIRVTLWCEFGSGIRDLVNPGPGIRNGKNRIQDPEYNHPGSAFRNSAKLPYTEVPAHLQWYNFT